MTQKSEMQVLTIDLNSIPEYQGAKEKQENLVKENPYVEIDDSTTYELAKKNRTSLRQGRYELQNGEKAIASQIKKFRDFVKIETEKLISITLPHEEKQQTEVERYEAVKQAEKEERERLDRERIERNKNLIIEFRQLHQMNINKADLSNIDEVEHEIINTNLEIEEEFESDLQLVKDQLIIQVTEKREQLDKAESMRLEQERLAAERKKLEEDRKAQEAEFQRQRDEAEARRKAEDAKLKEKQKIAQAKLKEQEDKAAALRKAEEEKLAQERAEIEAEKQRLKKAEEDRLAKEKAEKEKQQAAIDFREALIQEAVNLTGNTIEQTRQLSNEELESEIKRIKDAREKARLDALKSDKEKALEIVKSLSIQYDESVKIHDEGLYILIGDFIEKADALMKQYTKAVETY